MNFTEAFSWLIQDEFDRRFALSGLPERKDLKDFDWTYNPQDTQEGYPGTGDNEVYR